MATPNSTQKRTALQREKAHLQARLAEIEAQLAELELADAVQEVLDSTPRTPGQRTGKAKSESQHGSEHWYEERVINGCGPYWYERWWDGNKRRSKYHGKNRPA